MNHQLNLSLSRQARDKGIAKAEISIDDVKQYCHNFNIEITHPNLCGAVFKGGDFECCGFAPSKQVSRHAGLIRLWRLKEKFVCDCGFGEYYCDWNHCRYNLGEG